MTQARISWERNVEHRYPYGSRSPDPDRLEPLGFPPPWPDRPWIYSNVITSRNGIIAWTRRGPDDDPIRAIAGGDFTRPGRRADVQLMRYLRACADAVSVGAQTIRDQPGLIGTLGHAGSDLGEVLERFRASQGLRRLPLQVVYTQSGDIDLDARLFNTPGVEVLVITTEHGARRLRARGSQRRGVTLVIEGEESLGPSELVRAHRRLRAEFAVRYLDCEGGATILDAFHDAGIADEIFVTMTDVRIDLSEHEGVKRLFSLEGARLIAEGHTESDASYVFRRWRINER
ncbi:MAG TPA: dihydrofolate reductase family protein [Terriglobales bacterium]|nr:dihydrofolate reductase family protein [Terriglobales bacterium]